MCPQPLAIAIILATLGLETLVFLPAPCVGLPQVLLFQSDDNLHQLRTQDVEALSHKTINTDIDGF